MTNYDRCIKAILEKKDTFYNFTISKDQNGYTIKNSNSDSTFFFDKDGKFVKFEKTEQ